MPDNRSSNVTISDVKVRLVEHGTDGLLAWASCVVDSSILLNNIAIRRGRDGSLFLTYPAKRATGGHSHHYFHPISVEAADAVQDAILTRLAALAKAAAEGSSQGQ